MICEKCNDTGWFQYIHDYKQVCDACCKHDGGWWELSKEFHGSSYIDGADNMCCKLGCGTMRRDLNGKTSND